MTQEQFSEPLGSWYRLGPVIGRGATGEVRRGVDTRTSQTVAAKILHPEHADEPGLVERFLRERSVLVGLRSPHVVAVRDLVAEGGRLAIVMDHVAGGSLRDVLDERGTVAPALATSLVAGTLDGLADAHEAGINHRDVKPDNVLLEPQWEQAGAEAVRVTDFGIAGLVADAHRSTTGLLGTPQYMAPELISTGHYGAAADVYAAGVMLYELLAGRTPFAGPGNDFTVAYRHVTSQAPALPVASELWQLLERLLDKDPRQRPGAREAASMLRQLSATLAGAPALEPAATPQDYHQPEHPLTMLKGLGTEDEGAPALPLGPHPAPELGQPSARTRLKPLPRPATTRPAVADETAEPATGADRRRIVLVAAAVAGSLAVGGAVWWAMHSTGGGDKDQDVAWTATQRDQPTPTGLTISRKATYDPQRKVASLTLTYSAQRTALQGPFFQVLPPADSSHVCPTATWTGREQQRNLISSTGIDVDCSWSLVTPVVPARGSIDVTAQVALDVTDEQALQKWLDDAATQTTQAMADTELQSPAFPVQRLQNVQVVTPAKAVTQTAVPITLLPVWPSGPDPLNPLYKSPAVGEPSSALTAIAGGEQGIRFRDECQGSLKISGDGLLVSTLSMVPQCHVGATVGNFTDLTSNPFAISTRGS